MNLPQLLIAIAGLGLAAEATVDVSKIFGGGISNCGFGDIKRVISRLIPLCSGPPGEVPALGLQSVLATLRAHWLNGVPLADQKSAAKGLIEANLTPETAGQMAAATGVDRVVLASVAVKLMTGEGLDYYETGVYDRFVFLLSALLDQGYERAQHRSKASVKLMPVPVAVALALLAAFSLNGYMDKAVARQAAVVGLLAGLLAPVARTLITTAWSKLVKSWKL
jgi:hypothetical protein